MQSGIIGKLLVSLLYVAFKAGTQQLTKRTPELNKYATNYIINKELDRLVKDPPITESSGITLANNERKDIMKVITCLENGRILLKRTPRKITSHVF